MVTPFEPATAKSSALRALGQRAFVEQMSDPASIDEALDAGPVSFYIGYDPTARSLHAGNLVCIMAMRLLQRLGHRPIVLLGGATARVGDPSGRSETRRMLDEATIDANAARIGRQFERFLSFGDGPTDALVLDNATWLVPQRYIDFLRDIGTHFTVNRMISTKTYRDRLDNEQPLSFTEFNYQLLQAYDFLYLHREHGCRMQLGGSDQWGNMVAGVELIRRVGQGEHGPAHCLTFPLLTTADGRKMGKTEKGAVWLDPDLFPPLHYYQYWISVDDRDVRKLLLMFTDLPLQEIDELCKVEGAALRAAKERLAFEATALAHGEDEATKARAASQQAFGGSEDWSAVPAVQLVENSVRLVDLVVDDRIKAFGSKRQARQRIEGGAVRIDGQPVTDPSHTLQAADFEKGTLRLQAGKKCRFRVVLGPTS